MRIKEYKRTIWEAPAVNNQPIPPHNGSVTLAIIQLVISDTPLSLATSLLKSSVRHIILLAPRLPSPPLLHSQMVKIHNSQPKKKKKKTSLDPHFYVLFLLPHYSHCGSLLANSSPLPQLIKLSFFEAGSNSLAGWEGVSAPGEATCYSRWLIQFTVRGKLACDGGGPAGWPALALREKAGC